MTPSNRDKTNKPKTNKWVEEKIGKFIGFNDRGIVTYSDGLAGSKYRTPFAICNNCGASIKGKKTKDWMFGHVGCPKPNGEYLKNDFTAKDLRKFIKQLITQTQQETLEWCLKVAEQRKLDISKNWSKKYREYRTCSKEEADEERGYNQAVEAIINTIKQRKEDLK